MGKFLSDFKAFAMRGNVVDMAVGVIIGGAFGKIVSSLVDDIIMPLISVVTGGHDFKNLSAKINDEAELTYGMFIQNIVDFLIIAFCIFMAIRFIQKFKKQEEEAPAAPAGPTKEEELLTQIRDLLKEQNAQK
ncbi:MAG: large-conductance mechanosensitive channel protein MscL [Muribaculaceae bacterium]|nr:large-conductance mechanosensitive channel protein MscL [Muribaculaceae bacterium]